MKNESTETQWPQTLFKLAELRNRMVHDQFEGRPGRVSQKYRHIRRFLSLVDRLRSEGNLKEAEAQTLIEYAITIMIESHLDSINSLIQLFEENLEHNTARQVDAFEDMTFRLLTQGVIAHD